MSELKLEIIIATPDHEDHTPEKENTGSGGESDFQGSLGEVLEYEHALVIIDDERNFVTYGEFVFLPSFIQNIHSGDLLPKPFQTARRLVVCSILSMLCNICFGAVATKLAVDAKRFKDRGLHITARWIAKWSLRYIIGAHILGILFTGMFVLIFYC